MNWQKRARLVIAVGGVAFAIVVALGFRKGAPVFRVHLATSDPTAVMESSEGVHDRTSKSHEDVAVAFEHLTTYTNGSEKLDGISVTTTRANGRHFKITAKAADVSKNETEFALSGNVRIEVNDGMVIHTERATYTDKDGLVHAPGPVDIARGRMTGSANGMTYDKNTEILTLLESVHLHMAADERGAGAMEMQAPIVAFNRVDKTMFFEKGLTSARGPQQMSADSGVAHLSADEERLETIDLHGNARIRGSDGGVGGLRSIAGHDITLRYGADGQSIEHALVLGDALIQLAGEGGHAGRQIGANLVDLALAADGSTPTGLTANSGVQLTFPPEQGTPGRTINADHLDGRGDDTHGLTTARFDGNVSFREQGGSIDRRAKSQVLEASLGPGMSALEEARFSRSVRFEDASMAATAGAARYVLDKGTLDLTTDAASGVPPHAETELISVDSPKISIVLDGPVVSASSPVKSVLKPQKSSDAKNAKATKTPTMLKKDQDVFVTANTLEYDGNKSRAAYTGDVRLTQGDTSIKAISMVIDDKTGDLSAAGDDANPVATTMVRMEESEGKKPERTVSTAKAKDMTYEDAERRLAYTGAAHMNGVGGDMTADKIELYLKPSGDEIERVEAYTKVTLTEKTGRVTTGSRLTYTAVDDRSVVVGTPVQVNEACGRRTTGQEITLLKSPDRLNVSGQESTRAQTLGTGASCP